jgi:hypothetical protein
MVFVNSQELVEHKKAVHLNKMYQCQSCNKFFDNKERFEKHITQVHSEKNHSKDFDSNLPATKEVDEYNDNENNKHLLDPQ